MSLENLLRSGSSYCERIINNLKEHLTKEEDLWCDDENDNTEDLNIY